jgi:poly[(R)-3-hydroxyalkanoate] polymerase subunit PhaC
MPSLLRPLRRVRNAVRAVSKAAKLLSGATPHEVVWSSGPVSLRYYAPRVEVAGATPLLLVMPVINRFRIVDLAPGQSLVESLVERGIPVYLVDWGEPRRIDNSTDFEDYVLRYLPQAARRLPAERFDVMGYCLGGTISVMFAATHPHLVRRFVTLNTPVDFHTGEPHMDLMTSWVDPRYFPVERLTSAFGNMPGRLIQQGFLWNTPVGTMLKGWRAWDRFDDQAYAERFTFLESWNQDAVDVPGAAYRRLIQDLYRSNLLAQSRFPLRDGVVDLRRITCPLMVISARRDTICPPGAATALLDLVGSSEKTHLELRGGHVAPVVASSARAELHDPLADWLLS